jgi:hypothetical protein
MRKKYYLPLQGTWDTISTLFIAFLRKVLGPPSKWNPNMVSIAYGSTFLD